MDVAIGDNKLFVADSDNGRVLVWDPIPAGDDAEASVVIGRSDWALGFGCGTARNALCDPIGVEADASGVYVTDRGNNRVMIWDSVPAMNGVDDAVDGTRRRHELARDLLSEFPGWGEHERAWRVGLGLIHTG